MAQTEGYPDRVELYNGSVLKCKILSYELDGDIKLEILGGSILVYPSKEVKKIEHFASPTTEAKDQKEKATFHIFEKGDKFFYLGLDFLGGLKDDGWGWTVPTLGIATRVSAGKVLNRHLMLGGGIGWVLMDNTIMFSSHIPIYMEARGDLIKRNYAFYYSASLGYNWALRQRNVGWNGTQMMAARGGIYFNPALGLRFAARGSSHFCLELGYSIHTASYEYLGADGSTALTKNLFMRPKIGCGIMF